MNRSGPQGSPRMGPRNGSPSLSPAYMPHLTSRQVYYPSPSDHLSTLTHGDARSTEPGNDPNVCSVYVGNVSHDANHKNYFSYFKQCGHIVRIDVRQGFGFVHYDHPNSVRKAVKHLHNACWLGRNIRVQEKRHDLCVGNVAAIDQSERSDLSPSPSTWSTSLAPTRNESNTFHHANLRTRDVRYSPYICTSISTQRSARSTEISRLREAAHASRLASLAEPALITPRATMAQLHFDNKFGIFLNNLFRAILDQCSDSPELTSSEVSAFRDVFTFPEANYANNGSLDNWKKQLQEGEVFMRYMTQERLESTQYNVSKEEIEWMLDKGRVAGFARRLGLECWIYGTKEIKDKEVFYVFAGIVSVLLKTIGIWAVRVWLEPWLEDAISKRRNA